MALLVATLCIGFCGFITFIIESSIKINSLKEENERLLMKCVSQESIIDTRDALIRSMSSRIRSLELEQQFTKKESLPPDTMKALKKAVFYSHPDKGGNAEDFILCNKVYNELKRKGYN